MFGLFLSQSHIQCTMWKAWILVPWVPVSIVERNDMPGMASDSCSWGNVCVTKGNGWIVWKSCHHCTFCRWKRQRRDSGYMCYFKCIMCVCTIVSASNEFRQWLTIMCLEKFDTTVAVLQKANGPQLLVHVTFSSKYTSVCALIEEQDLWRTTTCQPR